MTIEFESFGEIQRGRVVATMRPGRHIVLAPGRYGCFNLVAVAIDGDEFPRAWAHGNSAALLWAAELCGRRGGVVRRAIEAARLGRSMHARRRA